jgi:hypothetical protein
VPVSTRVLRFEAVSGLSACRGALLAMMVGLTCLACGGAAVAVEEPPFEVLVSDPPFELRRYPGFVVAETLVEGDFDGASRSGFRRVAAFIFGGNTAADGSSRKIAMTAPVTVVPEGPAWKLHFVMPPGSDLATLPRPTDPRVRLRAVPEHRAVAVRFSGWTTEAAISRETVRLRAWSEKRGLALAAPVQVARYNDPFTLPWRRRNEILIELAPGP